MLESRANIKNPLKKKSGKRAAWYLFAELGYPFDDFEKFRRILWAAIVRSPWLYYQVIKQKRSGGKRILNIPHKDLKLIQKAINKRILQPLGRHPNVYGFSGGGDRRSNLQMVNKAYARYEDAWWEKIMSMGSHSGIRHVMQQIANSGQSVFITDVKDAFPATSGRAVFHFFRSLNFGYYASYYLTCLTTWSNRRRRGLPQFGLPQGAPTSPRLFDLCFRQFDKQLAKLAKNVNGLYFRYADNIFLTAAEFWPERIKKEYELLAKIPVDFGQQIIERKIDIPCGKEDIKPNEEGKICWHSPVISAVYRIVARGYYLNQSPDGEGWWRNNNIYSQYYKLHKSYFARRGQILHALGLNIVNGQLYNTREFKRRLRMTIFNLKKALEQKNDFETIIWPLYHKLNGTQNFIIKESSPKLWEEAEQTLFQVALIRYSGRGGTYVRNINEY